MKRYIKSSKAANLTLADIITGIDLIVVANNAKDEPIGTLPITAASSSADEDYDKFSIEELCELDDYYLRKIASPYALDNLNTAIEEGMISYKLTGKQREALQKYLSDPALSGITNPTKRDASEVLDEIKQCQNIIVPEVRLNDPLRNFALVHHLDMRVADYLGIIKQLTSSELFRVTRGADLRYFGTYLFEFKHSFIEPYKLLDGNELKGDILIYMKLLPHYSGDYCINIISFHDADI